MFYMFNLGHIEPKIEQLKGLDFFCTITLPKRFYRRRPTAQYKVMDNIMKHIANNYLEEAYGCYELTQKGNIHSHWICRPKDTYLNENPRVTVALMSALLKQYSNCDFQLIKNKENTLQYIYKDKDETIKVLENVNPVRSIRIKDRYINPLSNQIIEHIHICESMSEYDDIVGKSASGELYD